MLLSSFLRAEENERVILANCIMPICLESALFFCTFAVHLGNDAAGQETPATK
jgi:hypothetical protein